MQSSLGVLGVSHGEGALQLLAVHPEDLGCEADMGWRSMQRGVRIGIGIPIRIPIGIRTGKNPIRVGVPMGSLWSAAGIDPSQDVVSLCKIEDDTVVVFRKVDGPYPSRIGQLPQRVDG